MLASLYLLLLAGGLAGLHALLARRRPFPLAGFVLAGAAWHLILGMVLLGPALAGQVERGLLAILWFPALGLGLSATGAVFALAWLGLVHGLSALARRWKAP